MHDRCKMEISGRIGVRFKQTKPKVHRHVFDESGGGIDEDMPMDFWLRLLETNAKVHRHVFDESGGGIDERHIEIWQRPGNGCKQLVSMLWQCCQQAGQSQT